MKKITLLIICVLGFHLWSNAGTVYYVSSTATLGLQNGSSWDNAFLSPGAAIASTTPVSGDEIWVKQGTYVITAQLSWETGQSFYGGFVGTETLRSQRSTDATLTVLDGNNLFRVLNAPSMASPTTWDGFTIQKGLSSGGGGGAFLQKNAILSNCIFQNNKATDFGGGAIYIQGATGDADSIKVINCTIKNNTMTKTGSAKRGGGGIYVKAGSFKTVIRGCTIESNTADGLAGTSDIAGGGVYLCDGTLDASTIKNNIITNRAAASPFTLSTNGKCQGGGIFIMPQAITTNPITVRNCTVSGNYSEGSVGGGISIDPLFVAGTVITAPVNVTRTIITNNWAYKAGGGVMTDGLEPSSTSNYVFANCVIANNESSTIAAGGGGAFINNVTAYTGTVSFTNCTVVNNKMLTSNYGGAGIYYNNIKSDITNCAFWGNGGVTTFYNIKVKNTLTTNKLINCVFDSHFNELEVSPVATPADLTGKVIVDVNNTGSTGGTLYANFTSPTNFIGKTLVAGDITSLASADWSIASTSACKDAGTTVASVTNDILGTPRPQGAAYDIGAYEVKTIPVLDATTAASSITSSSASSGGNITANGGASVSARGVCWNQSINPTISSAHTTNGTGNGSFTSSFSGLQPNKTYYVRAYATNSVGTGYGAQISFTTLLGTPDITFSTPTSVSKSYGDAKFTNTAGSSNSAGAITYSSGNISVATVDASTGEVTILTSGSAVITANIAANGDYNSGSSTYTLNVSSISLTVSGAAATNKAYDGTNTAVISGTLSGIINSDDVSLNGTGTFADINIANGISVTSTSTLGGTKAANYTLTQPTGLTANITAIATTISSSGGIGNSSLLPGSDLTVQSGVELVVDNTSTVHAITVNPGAKLTLNSSKTLIVGSLTLQSNENGTGTFVDEGGTLTATTTKVEQHLTAGRNWYVSIPVTAAASSVLNRGTSVIYYDEPTGEWLAPADGTLLTGHGYVSTAVRTPDITGTTGTVDFSGTLYTGSQPVTLTRSGGNILKSGFNLIGNPYPSYLNAMTAINANSNVLQTIWYRTRETSGAYNYAFETVNTASGVGTNAAGTGIVTGYVPPMQAFWVRTKIDNQTLTFTNSMRSHANPTDVTTTPLKAPTQIAQELLRLQISDGISRDETVIYTNSNADNSYDNYDSPKMSNNIVSIPEIYTQIGTEQLAINGMNAIPYDTEIALGFTTGQSNAFIIKASQFSNFAAGTQIILRDKVLNTEQDLTIADYSFSSDAVSTTNRFTLVFKAPTVTTGINQGSNNNNWILLSNNQIIVNGVNNESTVVVYNEMGQILISERLTVNAKSLGKFVSGVYMVTVTNSGKCSTTKVIIK